jgi:uncharacterized protein (UPF0276 family)
MDIYQQSVLADKLQNYHKKSFRYGLVGLSLGSVDALNQQHLQNLKNAIARFKPDLVSDHLSWSSTNLLSS